MLTSGFTITALVCIFLLTVALLLYYPAKNTTWYVYFWVFISWFLAFGIVVLIPYGVYSTLTPNATDNDRSTLHFCWRVVYWTVFMLCWLVLPILQQYELMGEYTRWRRLKRAIRRLLWMYFLMATSGLIFVVYLGFIGDLVPAKLPSILIAFSNCWGLLQTILLLGYGLVAVPKYLWFEPNHTHYLHYLAYKAARISEEKNDFQLELFTLAKLANAAQYQVVGSDKMRGFLKEIVKNCREEDLQFHREHQTQNEKEVQQEIGEITMKKLEVLNRLLKQAAFSHHRACAQWDKVLTTAFNVMDLIDSQDSPDRVVNSALWDRHKKRSKLTQLYCAIPLAYLLSCCYFALFDLKLSGFYGLYGHNQTDAPCLAWNAAYLARMACPMSLNYLLFIKVKDAEFFKVMSVIDFVPFMGEGFCIWFPLLLVVFCALSLFNVYPLILEWLGFPQFIIGRSSHFYIEAGLSLLNTERSKAEARLQPPVSDYTHNIARQSPLLQS